MLRTVPVLDLIQVKLVLLLSFYGKTRIEFLDFPFHHYTSTPLKLNVKN